MLTVGNILKLHLETGVRFCPLETIVVMQGSASLKEIEKEIIEHDHSDNFSIFTIYIYLYFIVLLLVNLKI